MEKIEKQLNDAFYKKAFEKEQGNNSKTCENCQCISFTKEEIEVLKEIAQERIFNDELNNFDEKGNPIPYRNRYSIEPPHLPVEEN